MSKATEQRKVVEVGRKVTRVNVQERKVKIFSIPEYLQNHGETNPKEVKGTQEYIEKYFPIAKVSTLHLEDEFLKHDPVTDQQRRFKEVLISAIKSGLSDFRAQRMDACFDEKGNICFKAGMKLALGKSANDWCKIAKDFMPEKESRLGTTKERMAFLALLIKYLIEENGYVVSDAWKAVCDQSKDLGHYWDSENAKHRFESTGSRQVGEWYDLANAYKITVDDETGGFSLVGGFFNCYGNNYPLVDIRSVNFPNNVYYDSIGWLVLSE